MRPEAPVAIHATAVSIGGLGLLITGPSKAGKSRLAFALIDASTRGLPIRLVGDDRVLLSRGAAGTIVRPHPRIAGFIERRGLGIVGLEHEAEAPVAAIVSLGGGGVTHQIEENFPVLPIVEMVSLEERCVMTLRWFAGLPPIVGVVRDKRTTPALENATIPRMAIKD